MNKNYVEKIAEMFGLKLYEPFIVKDLCRGTEYRYEFRETGLHCLEDDLPITEVSRLNVCLLRDLIIGVESIEIIKCSRKPKINEVYYLPNLRNGYPEYTWLNTLVDKVRYDMGLVCRTKEEAYELGETILKFWRQHND